MMRFIVFVCMHAMKHVQYCYYCIWIWCVLLCLFVTMLWNMYIIVIIVKGLFIGFICIYAMRHMYHCYYWIWYVWLCLFVYNAMEHVSLSFLEAKAPKGTQPGLYWKITWPPFIHTFALKIVTLDVRVYTVEFVKCFDIAVFCGFF